MSSKSGTKSLSSRIFPILVNSRFSSSKSSRLFKYFWLRTSSLRLPRITEKSNIESFLSSILKYVLEQIFLFFLLRFRNNRLYFLLDLGMLDEQHIRNDI